MIDRKLQLHFLLVLLVGVLVLSFFIIKPFALTIVLAAIFAIILQPLYIKIAEIMPTKKGIASFLTVFCAAICLLLPFSLIATQIFRESVGLYESISQADSGKNYVVAFLDGIALFSENFIPGTGSFFTAFSNNLDAHLKQILSWIIDHLGVALSGVSFWLLDLFIFFIALYYLIRDGGGLLKTLIRISPLDKEDMKSIFARLNQAVSSVIKGNLLIAALQGSLTAFGFWVFGVPNSLLWGTLALMTSLIPGVGTGVIILPGIIYLIITGHLFSAIGLTLWGVLIVGLVDNLLRPKLVGDALQVHPLLILLSIIGGLFLFGPVGLFLGPIVMSLLFAFIHTYGEIMEKTRE